MLTLRKLKDRVKKIGDSHRRINSGGCAEMACMLYEALSDKVEDIRLTTNASGGAEIDIDSCRERVAVDMANSEYEGRYVKYFWQDYRADFGHVWVEFKLDDEWYVIDSTGTYPAKKGNGFYERWGKPAKGSFTLEEMKRLCAEDTWNTCFDREQLPSMRMMVNNLITVL